MRVKYPETNWWKLVWFSIAIPKHAFISWLVCRDALITKQKMVCWGYMGDHNCLFCHGGMESREHLFFICRFSKRIWRELMADCSFIDPPLFWGDVVDWGNSMLQGKTLKTCLDRLCFGAVIYHIWRHRNDLQHGNTPKSEEVIVATIKWVVQSRVLTKGRFKDLSSHLGLVYRWHLHPLLKHV
jgi:hypothetical protein